MLYLAWDIDGTLLLTNRAGYDALQEAICDYFFRKELRAQMTNIKIRKGTDIMDAIVSWIIEVFDNYEVGYTKNIYFSRWI